jgi:hypothetical protein
MHRTVIVTVAALVAVVLSIPAWAQTPTLNGAWRVTAVTRADGKVNSSPEPGLYIFTGRHYSIQLVNAPRPSAAGNQSPDKERLAAYDAFTANTGTYEVNGSTLTTRPMVAKNPSVMSGQATSAGSGQQMTIKFEGSSVLYLTSLNPDGKGSTVRRLQRLE